MAGCNKLFGHLAQRDARRAQPLGLSDHPLLCFDRHRHGVAALAIDAEAIGRNSAM